MLAHDTLATPDLLTLCAYSMLVGCVRRREMKAAGRLTWEGLSSRDGAARDGLVRLICGGFPGWTTIAPDWNTSGDCGVGKFMHRAYGLKGDQVGSRVVSYVLDGMQHRAGSAYHHFRHGRLDMAGPQRLVQAEANRFGRAACGIPERSRPSTWWKFGCS